ncbi:zinc ribbon domain-containing protein [Egicoccus halophilus]|uniref:NAD glycohydrolase translocation F5/8 type C domain-containing protein n=1 Tax=Egicoccus halophilus TaxID=1670830 RepID=A0A8J3A716_9ACTN|nr:zinc ribbon domain-containing protein [Egicoccus halophilus]GGI04977.1 hypothetical protein GCM10011354_11780 [Egicoccus halophilus]
MTSDAGEATDRVACQHCGTLAGAGARFCRACGVALADATAEHTASGDTGVLDGGRDADGGRRGHTRGSGSSPDRSGRRARRRSTEEQTTGELDRAARPGIAIGVDGDGAALRPCPSCGGPNSVQRELCGRCGADLDSGASLPRADAGRATSGRPGEEDEVRRSRLGPLLALLGVVGAAVAGVAVAGAGPFGPPGTTVPAVEFDPLGYPGEPVRLPVAEIATLTTLPPQGNEVYTAAQMVDDDPTTAWNSDGAAADTEHGVGERIELVLEQPGWVDRLVLRNGDQRDADAYAANARIQRAQLTLDGDAVVIVNLLDEGLAAQAVEFDEPVLTSAVSIEVLDTFPGDTHPDLAVSDLELQGWLARGGDVEVARERASSAPAIGGSDR